MMYKESDTIVLITNSLEPVCTPCVWNLDILYPLDQYVPKSDLYMMEIFMQRPSLSATLQ